MFYLDFSNNHHFGLTFFFLLLFSLYKSRVTFKGQFRISLFSLTLQEDQNRGKPNWEHLNDELHVLITVEDSENRAQMKLQRAIDEVKKLLVVVSYNLNIQEYW